LTSTDRETPAASPHRSARRRGRSDGSSTSPERRCWTWAAARIISPPTCMVTRRRSTSRWTRCRWSRRSRSPSFRPGPSCCHLRQRRSTHCSAARHSTTSSISRARSVT
jgi:hypothetical protein